MALPVTVLFVALVGLVTAQQPSTTGNANDFVDNVLNNIRADPEFRNKVDPLIIDDIEQDNIIIRDGVVTGLLSLHRSGDCSLDYEEDTETMTVDAEMKVHNILFTANYSAKAYFFWITGDIEVTVDVVDIGAGFAIPAEGRPKLLRFKIKALENIVVRNITGVTVALNWLAKLVANLVVKYMNERIKQTAEEEIAKFISKTLETVDIPM